MKPLERIFFIACCRAVLFQSYNNPQIYGVPIKRTLYLFVLAGFPEKQLVYYIQKWMNRGFYNFGVNILCGWFEFEKLSGEYKEIYDRAKCERYMCLSRYEEENILKKISDCS